MCASFEFTTCMVPVLPRYWDKLSIALESFAGASPSGQLVGQSLQPLLPIIMGLYTCNASAILYDYNGIAKIISIHVMIHIVYVNNVHCSATPIPRLVRLTACLCLRVCNHLSGYFHVDPRSQCGYRYIIELLGLFSSPKQLHSTLCIHDC